MPTPAPAPKDPHECYWCQNHLPHPRPVRVHVHVPPRPMTMDPILANSLLAFWSGLFLMGVGVLLEPPKLTIAINPEAMD